MEEKSAVAAKEKEKEIHSEKIDVILNRPPLNVSVTWPRLQVFEDRFDDRMTQVCLVAHLILLALIALVIDSKFLFDINPNELIMTNSFTFLTIICFILTCKSMILDY